VSNGPALPYNILTWFFCTFLCAEHCVFVDTDGNVLEYPAASTLREVRQQVSP